MDHQLSVDQFIISFEQNRDKSPISHSTNADRSVSFEFCGSSTTAVKVDSELKKRKIELLWKLRDISKVGHPDKSQNSSLSNSQELNRSLDDDQSIEGKREEDLVVRKMMKLLKFEEELAQRHMIQWTNYEIARNQAKMYEQKWTQIKEELTLLNYKCEFLKAQIEEMDNQRMSAQMKHKVEVAKQKQEIRHQIIDSKVQKTLKAFFNKSFASKFELSLELGIDIFSDFQQLKKKGLVVRYMRFDPLMESSSYVHEITRKQQHSYFINFQIN